MQKIKNGLKKTPLYPAMRALKSLLKNRHRLQKLATSNGYNFQTLGSEYGGWTFVETEELNGSTIISAGLGEDASFDIEFARKYNAEVVIVDPTPRAIKHFNGIVSAMDSEIVTEYDSQGTSFDQLYNLENLNSDQLRLVDKALWNKTETLKFYLPADPSHVSHSIVNFQHDYRDDTDFIEVEAFTVSDLLEDLNIKPNSIQLMKLDIEGAEVEVVIDMLERGIRPKQLCIEYDEFNNPSEKGVARIERADESLVKSGYTCIQTDGHANFLYYRD